MTGSSKCLDFYASADLHFTHQSANIVRIFYPHFTRWSTRRSASPHNTPGQHTPSYAVRTYGYSVPVPGVDKNCIVCKRSKIIAVYRVYEQVIFTVTYGKTSRRDNNIFSKTSNSTHQLTHELHTTKQKHTQHTGK